MHDIEFENIMRNVWRECVCVCVECAAVVAWQKLRQRVRENTCTHTFSAKKWKIIIWSHHLCCSRVCIACYRCRLCRWIWTNEWLHERTDGWMDGKFEWKSTFIDTRTKANRHMNNKTTVRCMRVCACVRVCYFVEEWKLLSGWKSTEHTHTYAHIHRELCVS